MVGIVSYGAYIPRYRLSRGKIAEIWGRQEIKGEKAVANFDEDSVTMAVEAVLDCIGGFARDTIDGLFFATTSSPYLEKTAAALIAFATDMTRELRTSDFAYSLRAGTNAMASAVDAVNGGSAHDIVVAASDCRLGGAGGSAEQLVGDGAAAVLIGDDEVIASIEGSHFISEELVDTWRAGSDRFIRTTAAAFTRTHYLTTMQAAISELMNKCNLKTQDFSKVVFNAPNLRSHTQLAGMLGFDLKTQVQDPLFSTVGDSGVASALMILVSALEEAKPGDKLLLANYGNGCDAFVLQVTDAIGKLSPRLGVKGHLASRRELDSYEKILNWREMIQVEEARRPEHDVPSPIVMMRERQAVLGLYASRCKECGTVQYPPQRVCVFCNAKDKMEGYRLSDKKAKVFTFTKDYLGLTPNPPILEVVIDFEEGGRMICELIDCDPDEVKIGLPVEMTFRKLYQSQGITNYFWKARPTER